VTGATARGKEWSPVTPAGSGAGASTSPFSLRDPSPLQSLSGGRRSWQREETAGESAEKLTPRASVPMWGKAAWGGRGILGGVMKAGGREAPGDRLQEDATGAGEQTGGLLSLLRVPREGLQAALPSRSSTKTL